MKENSKITGILLPLMLACTGCSSDSVVEVVPDRPESDSTEIQLPDDTQEEKYSGYETWADTRSIDLTDAQRHAVSRNNDFAFNLFRTVSQSDGLREKSFALSPLSVTYALGMLNVGATGQTSQEITSLLGFGAEDKEAVNDLCRQLIEEAPQVNNAVNLQLANCVAIDKSLNLETAYQEKVSSDYYAEVASLPFESQESVDYINDWCNKHTNGMIPKLVENLTGVLAIINAIYFDAPWTHQFLLSKTQEETFTKSDQTQQRLPMMHEVYVYDYVQNDDYSAISMPYARGENWKMYVLLPNAGKTVGDVASGLTEASWNKTLKDFRECRQNGVPPMIDVKLPRFKTEASIELNDIISQMGAPSMFLSRGEFAGISSNYKDLLVSIIRQKSAIEVSEEGTTAAAVTIEIGAGSPGGEQTPPIAQFYANRPFVYLIQEASSGAIFFIGTYQGD